MPRLPFSRTARPDRTAIPNEPTTGTAAAPMRATRGQTPARAGSRRHHAEQPYLATEQLLTKRDARAALYPERVPVLDVTPEDLDAIRAEMETAVEQIAGGNLWDEHTAPVVAGLARTAFDRADAALSVRFRRAERLIAGEERVVVAHRSGLTRELERIVGAKRAAELVAQAEAATARAGTTNTEGREAGAAAENAGTQAGPAATRPAATPAASLDAARGPVMDASGIAPATASEALVRKAS